MSVMSETFNDFIMLGGYPRNVSIYCEQKNFSNILSMQKDLLKDYRDDISKYLDGFDIVRCQRVFDSIPSQLRKENHKFQFSKLSHGARFCQFYGVTEWLKNAGFSLISNNINNLEAPLFGNEEIENFRIYYSDVSFLVASLDDVTQKELRVNGNYGIYKGALYENITADALNKQGINLYFYCNKDSTIEIDFLLQFGEKIIPIEVKAKDGKKKSLDSFLNIHKELPFGIKFAAKNIGKEGNTITFPLFLVFCLKGTF